MSKHKELELTGHATEDNIDNFWNNWEDMNLDTPPIWFHSIEHGGVKFCLVSNFSSKELAITAADAFQENQILISIGSYTGINTFDHGLIGLWVQIK